MMPLLSTALLMSALMLSPSRSLVIRSGFLAVTNIEQGKSSQRDIEKDLFIKECVSQLIDRADPRLFEMNLIGEVAKRANRMCNCMWERQYTELPKHMIGSYCYVKYSEP